MTKKVIFIIIGIYIILNWEKVKVAFCPFLQQNLCGTSSDLSLANPGLRGNVDNIHRENRITIPRGEVASIPLTGTIANQY